MILRCPKCLKELVQNDSRYVCINNHSFDIAKEGYASLLLNNRKHTGDDKKMAKARKDFFSHDYYHVLKDAILDIIKDLEVKVIVDAGCGEGYYTNYLKSHLDADIYGFDMSKYALMYASKRNHDVHYFTASLFDMPLCDHSTDLILSIFAPIAHDEFKRVLRDDGYFIKVSPLPRHLWELKMALYDKPYENMIKDEDDPCLNKLFERHVEDYVTIDNHEDIEALFMMTPYYYRSPKSTFDKLSKLDRIEVSLAFRVEVFKVKS